MIMLLSSPCCGARRLRPNIGMMTSIKKHWNHEDDDHRLFDDHAGGCYLRSREMWVIADYYAPRLWIFDYGDANAVAGR